MHGHTECPISGLAVGIDVGGTNLRAGIVRADGVVVGRVTERVQKDRDAFARRIGEIVQGLDEAGVRLVGIGLPGRVDTRANLAVSAGYLDIAGLPFLEIVGTVKAALYASTTTRPWPCGPR